ncbi:MAG: DUF2752 domain-containing protein [Kiritimatiellia bacterium]
MTVLGLVLYCLALPFLSPFFSRILPDCLTACPFRTLTGNPCALCGLTRGLRALINGNVKEAVSLNPLCVPIAVLLFFEAVFRSTMLILSRYREIPGRVIRLDLLFHIALLATYLAYTSAFALSTYAY